MDRMDDSGTELCAQLVSCDMVVAAVEASAAVAALTAATAAVCSHSWTRLASSLPLPGGHHIPHTAACRLVRSACRPAGVGVGIGLPLRDGKVRLERVGHLLEGPLHVGRCAGQLGVRLHRPSASWPRPRPTVSSGGDGSRQL